MTGVDLSKTVEPRSDQTNGDDLLTGPRTILITKVTAGDADQPVSIHYEGADGKPYKPSKGMRRVLGQIWGWDGNSYVGRRLTIYRDAAVTFGKDQVGGIRISHMSDIDQARTLAVTLTRGKKVAYTVKPLPKDAQAAKQAPRPSQQPQEPPQSNPATQQPETTEDPPSAPLEQRLADFKRRVIDAKTTIKMKSLWAAGAQLRSDLDIANPELMAEMEQIWQARFDELDGPRED